jgi:hypothetical protein
LNLGLDLHQTRKFTNCFLKEKTDGEDAEKAQKGEPWPSPSQRQGAQRTAKENQDLIGHAL